MPFSPSGVWRATLVLIEAINNAMQHAHTARVHEWIDIALVLMPHRVTMTVIDQGPAFVAPRHRPPRVGRTHGRGYYLMRTLCRAVTVRRRGTRNHVRMTYVDAT